MVALFSSCSTLTLPPSFHSLFRSKFPTRSGVYKRLGQFDCGQLNCTIDHIKTCIHQDNDWIYIGEVKEGNDHTPQGIGIKVHSWGDIDEGYWKDGKLHGRGRVILSGGDYYIGEFKDGYYNGEGTFYYWNGDIRYEGGWKDNGYYGQGTYYDYNGDKYTGQWNDNYRQGEINYKDGNKYIGQWAGDFIWNIKRHGVGTLYSADGQVLNQGKWWRDEYDGEE